MGIDIIKNLTCNKKKRKIKFDLADSDITSLTFYSCCNWDKYKVPFEEMEDKRQISQIYVSLEEYARNNGDIQVALVEEFKETMKKLK